MFSKGDFVFTFDLQSAYHHIEIFPAHRSYLGFSWRFGQIQKYFVFNVLPFGIGTAAFIFTKVTRAVVSYWRKHGIKVIMYLDDGLAGSNNIDTASIVSEMVKADLERLGFLLSEEKCDWKPKQYTTWLGCDWNF